MAKPTPESMLAATAAIVKTLQDYTPGQRGVIIHAAQQVMRVLEVTTKDDDEEMADEDQY